MKPIMLIGLILIVLGVLALAYQGIHYTTREKVIKIGPIEATKETERTIPLPPLLGGLAVAGGVVLVIITPYLSPRLDLAFVLPDECVRRTTRFGRQISSVNQSRRSECHRAI